MPPPVVCRRLYRSLDVCETSRSVLPTLGYGATVQLRASAGDTYGRSLQGSEFELGGFCPQGDETRTNKAGAVQAVGTCEAHDPANAGARGLRSAARDPLGRSMAVRMANSLHIVCCSSLLLMRTRLAGAIRLHSAHSPGQKSRPVGGRALLMTGAFPRTDPSHISDSFTESRRAGR